jgi:hypothetical protein
MVHTVNDIAHKRANLKGVENVTTKNNYFESVVVVLG